MSARAFGLLLFRGSNWRRSLRRYRNDFITCSFRHKHERFLSSVGKLQTETFHDHPCQFAFTPVALTKAAFMLSSFLIFASSSAGVRTSGYRPIVVRFFFTFVVCSDVSVPF